RCAIYERNVSVLRVMRCLRKIGDRAFVILLLDPHEATVDVRLARSPTEPDCNIIISQCFPGRSHGSPLRRGEVVLGEPAVSYRLARIVYDCVKIAAHSGRQSVKYICMCACHQPEQHGTCSDDPDHATTLSCLFSELGA